MTGTRIAYLVGVAVPGRGRMTAKMCPGEVTARLLAEYTGAVLHPGTLNIRCPAPLVFPVGCDELDRSPYTGVPGDGISITTAAVNGVPCWAIRHRLSPASPVVELVAAQNLRSLLRVDDGTAVLLRVGPPDPPGPASAG